MIKNFLLFIFIFLSEFAVSQNQNKNWYFGNGTDGMIFNTQNVPVKVSNKYPGVGFEGIAVASDPCSGALLFYTDGIKVIDKNHNLMSNGTGMLANYSGSQCVQICKVPGTCSQYYVISNSSWDNTPGSFYYSIVDFSSNPLGQVTTKNQLINGPDYHQAMRIIPKTNSNNYWLIGHLYNTAIYHVFEITPTGFVGPVVYNFNNYGRSWTMEYNESTHKLLNMGQDNLKVSLFDFNPSTGVMSNEQQLYTGSLDAYIGNFSPDGSKIYAGLGTNVLDLWQYDFNNNLWTNMNTCCWAHDVKTGPDGITYFIHSFNDPVPLSKMTNANLSAVGNTCGYSVITTPGNFNGQVRRFPEFLQIPDPPVANLDTVTIPAGSNIVLNPLINDFDPQGDNISLNSIVSGPSYGTAIINGNQINYTANAGVCNSTDTITYYIVDNTCMCDTAQIIIHIQGVLPISRFILQSDFCTGLVTFTNQSQNGISYLWNFGDGLSDTIFNPAHAYSNSGNYTVTLIAYSTCLNDTLVQQININIIPVTQAQFSTTHAICSKKVDFYNESVNSVSSFWDFGDGTSSTLFNISHLYADTGVYHVILIAYGQCNTDTNFFIVPDTFSIGIASFEYDQQPCENEMHFINQSQNAYSVFWDFGDGTGDNKSSPDHSYSADGSYIVSMYVNQGTQCFDSIKKMIEAHSPVTSSLYIPNSFTPNNDGKNEVFEIFGKTDCESYKLYIYNRWGNLIYKTDDILKFWDGTMNDKMVQEGVYCYMIIGDNFIKTGNVSVIR